MNLALSEILGQELRFAKRNTHIGATKLNLGAKEVQIQIYLQPNFKLSKSCSSWLNGKRVVSLDLDERLKSCEGLKIRG